MKHRDLHVRGIGLLELMRCQPAHGLGGDTAGGYMVSLGSAQLLPNVLQHVGSTKDRDTVSTWHVFLPSVNVPRSRDVLANK